MNKSFDCEEFIKHHKNSLLKDKKYVQVEIIVSKYSDVPYVSFNLHGATTLEVATVVESLHILENSIFNKFPEVKELYNHINTKIVSDYDLNNEGDI